MDTDSVNGGTKSLYGGTVGGRPTTPGQYRDDCSKSVYGGELSREEEFLRGRGARSSLRRSQSSKMIRPGPGSDGRRNPYDHLPEAPDKMGGTLGRGGPGYQGESYNSDPAYSEYIRRKNAAADQYSGSSSGYYSSSKEQEERRQEMYDTNLRPS